MTRNMTKDDIRQSYRALSRVHHPDKGGDAQRFAQISKAYNVFMNETRREEYDFYIVSRRGRSLHHHSVNFRESTEPEREPPPHLGNRSKSCFDCTSTSCQSVIVTSMIFHDYTLSAVHTLLLV